MTLTNDLPPTIIPLLSTLNGAQQKAVTTLEGPLLILAGAGAGKTKTLTHRIAALVAKGVRPESILAITFTNKAAKEMKERVEHILTSSGLTEFIHQERPFVSTFHSLGVQIIREQHQILGVPRHFAIFDRADSKKAVKDALAQLGYDEKAVDPNTVLNVISRQKGGLLTATEFADKARNPYEKNIAAVWRLYDDTLHKNKAFDFDDLLLRVALLLRDNQAVREYYQQRWLYVHIDEYQDTNKVQYEIARMITARHRNICAVGDIDQTIYSWRGADIQNIINFEKDYSDAVTVVLEENYRSTQTILSAANTVIAKNVHRREKNLFTKNGEGEKIVLTEHISENDEAREITETIRSLIKKGVNPNTIAILYRANFQSRVLEEALLRKTVPYQVLGTKYYERKEVKDVVAYARAALTPENTIDIGRIINVPARGIGKVTALKILEGGRESLTGATREKVESFFALLARIKEQAETKPLSETIRYIIKESGLEAALRAGGPDDQERLENIRELASLASKFDTMPPLEAMEAFLTEAALTSDQDELKENSGGVRLMTVHAAKGLEFDHVFITGLEDDLFPHGGFGGEHKTESEKEEERRLFYVAVTRAKQRLYLSFAQTRTTYGSVKVNTPSPFLEDIDESLVERPVHEKKYGVEAIFIDF
jgi:DNA helicase-2/ATP-dependent DNA helicase PcrA